VSVCVCSPFRTNHEHYEGLTVLSDEETFYLLDSWRIHNNTANCFKVKEISWTGKECCDHLAGKRCSIQENHRLIHGSFNDAAPPAKVRSLPKESRNRVIGTATRYGLEGPGIYPRWGWNFPYPYIPAPGAFLASYTMSTESFPRLKTGYSYTSTRHLGLHRLF